MSTIKTWQERKKEQPLEPSSLLAQHEINELRTELAIERGCRIAAGGERDELRAKLAACKARERHTCGTLNKLLAAGAALAWNDFIEVACARIKSADDASADGDYMLDSDDCIKVLRGTWQGNFLHDKPAKQQHAAGAAPVLSVTDALPREDFAALVVQQACETEPADSEDPDCIKILTQDLHCAVLSALLHCDLAPASVTK